MEDQVVLAAVEINYEADSKIKALLPEQYAALRDGFTALQLPEDQAEFKNVGWDLRTHLIDLTTTGALLADLELPFTIKRFKSCYKVETKGPTSNVNLQVAIPNLLLWSVDEVMVAEDECTMSLQDRLNEGWRILAICPPAAQRRPDYILGRQKKDIAF